MKKKQKTFWMARDKFGETFGYASEPMWDSRVFQGDSVFYINMAVIELMGIDLKPSEKAQYKLVRVKPKGVKRG